VPAFAGGYGVAGAPRSGGAPGSRAAKPHAAGRAPARSDEGGPLGGEGLRTRYAKARVSCPTVCGPESWKRN